MYFICVPDNLKSIKLKKNDCENVTCIYQAPLLLTLINFNLIMDKQSQKIWDEITYTFRNFNDCTVKLGNG